MAAVVKRATRLNVTLYVPYLSCRHANILLWGDVGPPHPNLLAGWPLSRLTFPECSQYTYIHIYIYIYMKPSLFQEHEVSLSCSLLSLGCLKAKELSRDVTITCALYQITPLKVWRWRLLGIVTALSSAPADMALPAVLETKLGLQPNRN